MTLQIPAKLYKTRRENVFALNYRSKDVGFVTFRKYIFTLHVLHRLISQSILMPNSHDSKISDAFPPILQKEIVAQRAFDLSAIATCLSLAKKTCGTC